MVIRTDDDTLIELIKESVNMADLIRKMGRSGVSSSYADLKARINRLGIDTSHFQNATATKLNGKWRAQQLSDDEIFATNRRPGKREPPTRLKSAMIRAGFENKCGLCGIPPEWNGKILSLQVDHINGDPSDNRKENLRFLCPNCHSQTDTYGHKNIKSKTNPYKRIRPKQQKLLKSVSMVCIECGGEYRVDPCQVSRSKYCSRACYTKSIPKRSKIAWPSKEEMEDLIKSNSFSAIARNLGVSDRSVVKHCKRMGLIA